MTWESRDTKKKKYKKKKIRGQSYFVKASTLYISQIFPIYYDTMSVNQVTDKICADRHNEYSWMRTFETVMPKK